MKPYISLLEELKLVKDQADPHAPWFTGWRCMDMEAWVTNRTPDESKGFCGQIVQFFGDNPYKAVYVNLPGMQSGVVPEGGLVEVGDERVYADLPEDEMRKILVSGLKKLQEAVEEYKKGEPCPTAQTS